MVTRTRSVDIDGRLAEDIQDLEARSAWFSGDTKAAIKAYEKMAEATNSIGPVYTLARIHAKEGKRKAALKHLSTAMDAGFSYREIIIQDAVWHDYRDKSDWQEITSFLIQE